MRIRSFSALAALFAVTVFAPLPAHAGAATLSDKDKRQMEDEQKQGKMAADEIAKTSKFDDDPAHLARVTAIGEKLAAVANSARTDASFGNDQVYPFQWHFFIVKDKDVNAFSLPGGYVYVNTGLLDMVRSDDELAGVLGHEITHAAHHHIAALAHQANRMNTEYLLAMIAVMLSPARDSDKGNLATVGQYAATGLLNHYSIKAEKDADHGGVVLMQKAGYNPVGMLTFMLKLQDLSKRSPDIPLGIFQDHPFSEERVSAIQGQLTAMHIAVTPETRREVSSNLRASVAPAGPNTVKLLLGKKTVLILDDPTQTRAQAAANAINRLIASGAHGQQVTTQGGEILINNQVILQLTPADAMLNSETDPIFLAANAGRIVRAQLFSQIM